MWNIIKAELSYSKDIVWGYILSMLIFIVLTPDWPLIARPYLKPLPIYITYALAFGLFKKLTREKRLLLIVRLPIRLEQIAVLRLLLLFPFLFGLMILSIDHMLETGPLNLIKLETLGSSALFINIFLIAFIYADTRFIEKRNLNFIFCTITAAYLVTLIMVDELVQSKIIVLILILIPLPILILWSIAIFSQRRSFIKQWN